ncbi:albumin-2-like [Chenopodium quinoa]|uniref:Albumin-2 n=1 Tax=Chenopodium quinoa TaxID=63459 RepID=A0A803LLP0_CHEQI|nr:albumin-2-like [Chenopodium quinoa]
MSVTYVTAAFKSNKQDEAYIFMKNEYMLIDYAPGEKDDKILNGPARIGDVFSSLKDTVFADKGIDCAFASEDEGVSYIFSGNICAKWLCAPDFPNQKILEGLKPIGEMFPYLRGTVFEHGVDAAFDSSVPFEAYLFKDSQYARINYSNIGHLMTITSIRQNWHCLRDTMFENGFDAAFALHIPNQAYLFKGDSYGRIKFTPGSATDEELMWSGRIEDSWKGLGSILPRKN